jgi:hypothetical protein
MHNRFPFVLHQVPCKGSRGYVFDECSAHLCKPAQGLHPCTWPAFLVEQVAVAACRWPDAPACLLVKAGQNPPAMPAQAQHSMQCANMTSSVRCTATCGGMQVPLPDAVDRGRTQDSILRRHTGTHSCPGDGKGIIRGIGSTPPRLTPKGTSLPKYHCRRQRKQQSTIT